MRPQIVFDYKDYDTILIALLSRGYKLNEMRCLDNNNIYITIEDKNKEIEMEKISK